LLIFFLFLDSVRVNSLVFLYFFGAPCCSPPHLLRANFRAEEILHILAVVVAAVVVVAVDVNAAKKRQKLLSIVCTLHDSETFVCMHGAFAFIQRK
jgi:hypothetical protein